MLEPQNGVHMDEAPPILSQTPDVVSGSVVFAGTRVPVEMLFDYLAAGESLDDFATAFDIPREQALAAVKLAGEVLRDAPPERAVHRRVRAPRVKGLARSP